MQKWWLIGAGVVGIALAVLLIPRPDTGDDVPDLDMAVPGEVTTAAVRSPEGLVRAPSTTSVKEPSAIIRGDGEGKPMPNPVAARKLERRSGPEARFAAQAMAPWTQTRRLLALKKAELGDDPGLAALIESTNAMSLEMRTLRRDPESIEWSDIESRQRALITEVRGSSFHDDEIEKMLVLIEARIEGYYADAGSADGDIP